jgi:hypothetical protein
MNTPESDGRPADAQPTKGNSRSPSRRWWDPYDEQLVSRRSQAQADLIRARFKDAKIKLGVHRGKDGAVEYMYRPGVLLTRDEHAGSVYEALEMEVPKQRHRRRDRKRAKPIRAARGLHVVPLPKGRTVLEAVDTVDDKLGVGMATPEHLMHVNPTWCNSTEPELASWREWHGVNPDPETSGDCGLVVVVDTGLLEDVVGRTPWLSDGGVTGAWESRTVGHYSGHGTFVAGVVRAYAPKARVHVEPAFSVGGAAFETEVVGSLIRALGMGADVINLSAGTRTREGAPLLSFETFYENHLSQVQGTVLVASAGNDGDRGPHWPATFPWTLAVGALDRYGLDRVGFSNHGSWVDINALGTDVVNAFRRGRYRYVEPPRTGSVKFRNGLAKWSGTSFSAPMVAGLVVGRMTWSGESAEDAARSLIRVARNDARVGTGARLRFAESAGRSHGYP